MALNPKRQPVEKKKGHKNYMAGTSYDITSPILRLICMSSSSFFGEPMYYKGQGSKPRKGKHSLHTRRSALSEHQVEYLRDTLNAIDDYEWRNLSPAESMERAIDEALNYCPETTLAWAVELRQGENIRTTPQVILVRAANHKKVRGTTLVRTYAKGIIQRADEPAVQLAYQLSAFGKPVPNALRRAWADFLSGANDYQLAKYRMDNRVVKTVDVANLAFGRGFYGYDAPIGRLMRGELKLNDSFRTWESIRSNGGSWEEAIEVMGHMALLRNVRNFIQNKVETRLWLDKLVGTADKGKQLPFRYISAYNMVENIDTGDIAYGKVLDAIEECLMRSLGNLPVLGGRSLVLSDNSGSAHGTPVSELSTMTVAKIGNLMGVLTGYISDEAVHGVFGDRLSCMNIRKRASVLDQTERAHKLGKKVGGGTENGIWLALDQAIKNREHWDNIFVYSDMQAGHGGLYGIDAREYKQYIWKQGQGRYYKGTRYIDVAKMVRTYRDRVNSDVNVFLVQIAGYEDTLVPEFYDRTFIIGGWSGSIFKFAHRMIKTANEYKQ
jgi:hypothetical protein